MPAETSVEELDSMAVYDAMLRRSEEAAARRLAEEGGLEGDFIWRNLYRGEVATPSPEPQPAPECPASEIREVPGREWSRNMPEPMTEAGEPLYADPQPAPARPSRSWPWRRALHFDDQFAMPKPRKLRKKFTDRQIAEIANLIRAALVPARVGDKFPAQRNCFFSIVDQFSGYFYNANNGNFNANEFSDKCGRKLINKLYERISHPSPLEREKSLP